MRRFSPHGRHYRAAAPRRDPAMTMEWVVKARATHADANASRDSGNICPPSTMMVWPVI